MLNKKSSNVIFVKVVSCIIIAFFTSFASARPLKFSLGVGGVVSTNFRVDNNLKKQQRGVLYSWIPIASVSYGNFAFRGYRSSYRLIGKRGSSISLLAAYIGDDYRGTGMTSRKKSIFTGVGFDFFLFHISALKDTERESDGVKGKFLIKLPIPPLMDQKLFVRSHIGIEYLDQKYSNYYFGVRSNEITINRAGYGLGSTKNKIFNLNFIYYLTSYFYTSLNSNYKLFDKDIYNSPTVRKRYKFSSILMTVFSF